MTINGTEIDSPTREYNFIYPYNTINLYYDDLKDDFKCLFYGCSDIDEIDASNLSKSPFLIYDITIIFNLKIL